MKIPVQELIGGIDVHHKIENRTFMYVESLS